MGVHGGLGTTPVHRQGRRRMSEGSAGEMTSDFKARQEVRQGAHLHQDRNPLLRARLALLEARHGSRGDRAARTASPDQLVVAGRAGLALARLQLLGRGLAAAGGFSGTSGAGVKASVALRPASVRKDEMPDDDEAIFMTAPRQHRYDATGRKTARVTVKSENGKKRSRSMPPTCLKPKWCAEKAPTAGTGVGRMARARPPRGGREYRRARAVSGLREEARTFFV